MQSHRELLAWQVARQVVLAVFRYGDAKWTPGRAAMLDQLRRAALSVQLNIAEGFAVGRGPRCRNHWRIAYGSAVETTEVLELLQELGGELEDLISDSKRVQALTLRLWQRSRP